MEEFKIKPLTKNQLIISIDRLTRFKNPYVKYLRVFNEIILSNLIKPKYKKAELEELNSETIKKLAEKIINFSLKEINAQNATIYYSENANATSDVKKTENGWSTTASANAKVFLIVLDALNAEDNYTASYTIQLPSPIQKDATAYTEYEVIYNTDADKDVTTKSVALGFATPTEIKLETKLMAQVGNDTVNNGDTIKAGEVIKYTMTVKNNGAQAIGNIVLKANVPDGTVYVTPEEEYQHSGTSYYKEDENVKEVTENTNLETEILEVGDGLAISKLI